ncbi:hypothetical protein Pcinc_036980, partial [Petrolisthes cinctipes]
MEGGGRWTVRNSGWLVVDVSERMD